MTHYNNRMNPASIVRMLGFDYHMLGTKRVSNIAFRYKSQSERLEGLRDTRASSSGRPKTKNITTYSILSDDIKQNIALVELIINKRWAFANPNSRINTAFFYVLCENILQEW